MEPDLPLMGACLNGWVKGSTAKGVLGNSLTLSQPGYDLGTPVGSLPSAAGAVPVGGAVVGGVVGVEGSGVADGSVVVGGGGGGGGGGAGLPLPLPLDAGGSGGAVVGVDGTGSLGFGPPRRPLFCPAPANHDDLPHTTCKSMSMETRHRRCTAKKSRIASGRGKRLAHCLPAGWPRHAPVNSALGATTCTSDASPIK